LSFCFSDGPVRETLVKNNVSNTSYEVDGVACRNTLTLECVLLVYTFMERLHRMTDDMH